MKTGRNDPCPCGSGRKYKNCHADETPEKASSNRTAWIIVAVVVLGGFTFFASFRSETDHPRPRRSVAPAAPQNAAAAPTAPATPPPTDPPPGKVWSPEHGHWHNAPSPSQLQVSTSNGSAPLKSGAAAQPARTPVPQPAGPAPAGKVWSPEHGHWHDASTAAAAPKPPTGFVWSEEHKHWHRADEEAKRKAAGESAAPATTTTPAPDNR